LSIILVHNSISSILPSCSSSSVHGHDHAPGGLSDLLDWPFHVLLLLLLAQSNEDALFSLPSRMLPVFAFQPEFVK